MKFLSNEWFDKVAELRASAGDLELPPQIAETVINVTLTDIDGGKNIHISGGDFKDDHADDAKVTLSMEAELLRKIFLEMDTQAGMQAFFAGQIKVEGDVTKLMELQSYQPSSTQKALLDQIVEMTD
jgi:hypothetical protein